MATAKTATFEDLAKLATNFVTTQKGIWDHSAWMDFVSSVQKRGFDVSDEMLSNLGDLLSAMERFYGAAGSTNSIENAMKTIVDDSVGFIKRQQGVWGHSEWEEFSKTIHRNTIDLSEGTVEYLGGILESIKVFYALSPVIPVQKPASAAPKKPSPTTRPAVAGTKKAEMKPTDAKAQEKPSGKKPDTQDDLTAISGIGPALAKKLNAAGIVGYAQLAALSDEDIAHLEKNVIKFKGRVKRDDWVGQAKKLSQK